MANIWLLWDSEFSTFFPIVRDILMLIFSQVCGIVACLHPSGLIPGVLLVFSLGLIGYETKEKKMAQSFHCEILQSVTVLVYFIAFLIDLLTLLFLDGFLCPVNSPLAICSSPNYTYVYYALTRLPTVATFLNAVLVSGHMMVNLGMLE